MVDPSTVGDNDELFSAYVADVFEMDEELAGEDSISMQSENGDVGLNEQDKIIYQELKDQIEKVADGRESSTIFTVSVSDVLDTLTFYASDMGLTIYHDDTGWDTDAVNQAVDNVYANFTFNLSNIVSALMNDCPYELYWFDKTVGITTNYPSVSYDSTGAISFADDAQLTFSFPVASAYAGSSDYTTDTDKTGAATEAVANAQDIVDQYASYSDYDKLDAYREKICDLVSYNKEAVSEDYTGGYGDPWQLIYVFDLDPDTNVVCEGYSKAFHYLCQQSTFRSKYIKSRLAGGKINGGDHMWNIVTMSDQLNYLVDVTNCDEGTIGESRKLFLAAPDQGSVTEGYTFTETLDKDVTYCYDKDTLAVYSTDELTLSFEDYDTEYACNHSDTELVNVRSATCTQEGYSGDIVCKKCGETVEAGTTVDMLDHTPDNTVTENEKEATCTEEGSYDRVVYCSVCGTEISRKTETLDKLAHTPGEEVIENRQLDNCEEGGSYDKVVYCTVCNTELNRVTEEIEKGDHTVVTDPAVAPTCTKTGLTEGSHCSVCNTVFEAQQTIDALGHSWSAYKVTKKATVFVMGLKTRTCKRSGCKEVQPVKIAKLKPTIKLSASKKTLKVKKTYKLAISGLALGDSVKSVASSKKSVAIVKKINEKNYKIIAKKKGKATITVKLKSGKTAKCVINVK